MSEAKKQNYLHGAAIMVGTTVIVKIAAFFYKLPLGSMKLLGDEGFAHFMVAYNIYSFFLTLATAGFPVALSRMISEADTLDRPAQVQRIFRTAAGTLAAIGGFFTLLMLLFNRQLAVMMGNADAAPSILALAPAVVIVCLTSAYRGYCQGRGNMIPTAFGQVIEEVGKLVVGLTLAACGMFAAGLFLLYRAIVAVTTCPWINEEGVRAGVGVYMPWEDVHFGYVHRRAQVSGMFLLSQPLETAGRHGEQAVYCLSLPDTSTLLLAYLTYCPYAEKGISV